MLTNFENKITDLKILLKQKRKIANINHIRMCDVYIEQHYIPEHRIIMTEYYNVKTGQFLPDFTIETKNSTRYLIGITERINPCYYSNSQFKIIKELEKLLNIPKKDIAIKLLPFPYKKDIYFSYFINEKTNEILKQKIIKIEEIKEF